MLQSVGIIYGWHCNDATKQLARLPELPGRYLPGADAQLIQPTPWHSFVAFVARSVLCPCSAEMLAGIGVRRMCVSVCVPMGQGSARAHTHTHTYSLLSLSDRQGLVGCSDDPTSRLEA